MNKLYFIAGPTASGKSACAVTLAKKIDAEIVNADAIQVYAQLRLLTARPDKDEMGGVPHHLFGFLEGDETCSAGIWAREAVRVIKEIWSRGRPAICVGGTGLYFTALGEGLSPIPEIDMEYRARGNALYEEEGGEAFRERVLAFDPQMEWLPPSDRQRLVRAFEVYEATGKTLSYFQTLPRKKLIEAEIKSCVFAPEREALYARCDKRFLMMMDGGAVQEVEALLPLGLLEDHPVMKALGVPEIRAMLDGELSREEAVELAMRNTRRFAKRQMTWFRGQAGDWPRGETAEAVLEHLLG